MTGSNDPLSDGVVNKTFNSKSSPNLIDKLIASSSLAVAYS
tara:strand:- start:964 stop:1086 length:123 start_codon:yes stop_codon:yes gene_type:complete